MNGRRLAALAVGAGWVLFATGAAAGPPVQVNVYLPSYGAPQQQGVAPASSAQQAAANVNLTLQAQIAIAQLAAYQRYLQYVALSTAQGAPVGGAGGDPSQYFTNGAAATDVPTAGQPGAAYFNDGADATRVPGPRTGRQPPPPSPPPPPESPPQASPPPPPVAQPSAPLAPYWWVEGATPAAPPRERETSAPAPPPPPPPAPDTADERPAPAMSFEEWLRTMGADAREEAVGDPSLTSAEIETAPIAEPSAAVFDVRPRVPSALREKSRERLAARGGSGDVIAAMAGTFAAGLLLGALAMRRPRVRAPE